MYSYYGYYFIFFFFKQKTAYEMRISDWSSDVCSSDLRTTEQVERAFVEEQAFSYLYQDGDDYVFMNPESFEQLPVAGDMLGDQAAYLQEGMICTLSIHEGVAVAIQLPQRVTLEVTETEPTVKGQTTRSEERRVGKECVGTGRYRGRRDN